MSVDISGFEDVSKERKSKVWINMLFHKQKGLALYVQKNSSQELYMQKMAQRTLVILISLNIGALFIIILFGYYPWVPKFWVPNPHGYPWVIPKKTQNFELYGYPTRKYPWISDTNPTQPIPKIWFGSGYYPWVPEFWVPNPHHSMQYPHLVLCCTGCIILKWSKLNGPEGQKDQKFC